MDMSASRPDQDSLQERLDILQAVLNEVGAYVFTKDLQGRYTFVNRLVLELFNLPMSSIIGRDDSEFFDRERSAQLFEHDRRVMVFGETVETEEVNYIKGSEVALTYYIVKKPLYDPAGNIVGMCGISTDISEYKKLQQKAIKQQSLLESILEHVDAAIYMKDENSRYEYGNRKTCEHFGRPLGEVIGRSDSELLPPDFAADIMRADRQVLESGAALYAEETLPDGEGRQRHYWSVKVPIQLPDERPRLIGFSTDITALHQLKETLRQQSITDELTGLFNRRFLFETLTKELSRARRQQLDTALLLLDMDHFKEVNDRYGHPVGDSVLREFGALLRSSIRTEDTAARVGGEEFAVLLPDTNHEAAMVIAERIRAMTAQMPFQLENGSYLHITASIGLVHLCAGEATADAMYSEADRLLYKAKEGGRNRILAMR